MQIGHVFYNFFPGRAKKKLKLELTYNEKEAAGSHKWAGFSAYRDAIKFLAGLHSSYFWQASPLPPGHFTSKRQSIVGYSQVFQGLQA